MQVALAPARRNGQVLDGMMTWISDAPLPIAPVDGYRHLEIGSLLANLSELIIQALHPLFN